MATSTGTVLVIILLVALGLRLYGIDWDQGHGYHPDERSIYMRADCMYRVLAEAPGYADGDCFRDHPEMESGAPSLPSFLDADRSPLNPHWFPLGNLLIYLLVGFRFLLEPFMDAGSLLNMSYVGRSMMALADVGTVFMVFLLGKRVYDRRVGLLAAALVALAVIHIQHSHFYRPEPLLIFFLMVSFWFMLQVMERLKPRDSVLLGVFVGLAFAMKVSVLPLLLPLALAYGSHLFSLPEGKWTASSGHVALVARHALLAGVVALAVFFVTTPYAFLDIAEFVGQNVGQADMAKVAGTVPFTVQYVGSPAFLYELKQTSVWALGLPLGIVAWAGLLFTLVLTVARVARKGPTPRGELLLLAWVVPTFVLLGSFEVKFLRYIFPIIPFLILMGSGMLFWFLDRARSMSRSALTIGGATLRLRGIAVMYAPHAVIGAIVVVVVATALYALAFERIYTRPHPAIQASRWINDNVPRNSTIITDNHWDEGLRDIYSYKVQQIPIYEPDSSSKMEAIAGQLSEGDYLVFYSNRTYGSVARLPDRYPMSSRYYRLLFSDRLGYWVERAFTSYPELFGVAFVDDTFTRAGIPEPESLKGLADAPVSLNLGYADENFNDYDHPKVILLKNVEGLSRARLFELLTVPPSEEMEPELGLMLTPEQKVTQREGGTWSEIIKRDSWTNAVPILAWLLLVELIYLAALPLAIFLFRPLPDRGIILARILGILGVCYVAWLLASLGWVGFSRGSVLVGILVVAFLSGLVLATKWQEVKAFLVRNWRLLAIEEVIFLAAFLAFVAIRMADPDLWHPFRGGEKPMDFAYLNAVLRSTSMPPYDPWFAGGYLNYYYWGQFIVATLIKGTGIVPSVAYNLAVPLLFALTVTGAYSLVYNVAAGVGRLGPTAPSRPTPAALEGPGDRRRGLRTRWLHGIDRGPVGAGLVASLFVAVIGNLGMVAVIVKAGWDNVVHGAGFPSLAYLSDFWRTSRMLPQSEDVTPSALTFWLPDRIHPEIGHHITEFPFFSFLFADLHAHMIVIPFSLLAVGLALSLLVGLRTATLRGLALGGVALALALGSLWAINSWDYPTYVILAVVLMAVGAYLRPGKPLRRLAIFFALAAGTVLLSILAFLPFHASYHPFPTGLDVSKWQTPLLNYLGIHGLFLFLIVSCLLYLSRDRLKELFGFLLRSASSAQASSRFWEAPASTLGGVRGISWAVIAGVLVAVVAIYLAVTGYWTAAMLSLILVLTAWVAKDALSRKEEGASYAVFPLLLIALALLISIGVEFVRAQGDIGRMNTLFKYYLEVWVLLGMASAYMLWYLASRGAFRIRISLFRGAWLVALAILLCASFLYPALGTRSRLSDRFSTESVTLDGADYMKTAVHREEGREIELRWDYEAIIWLQDNVRGSPVVLEAHNEQYHWSSRIADYTGLPTVLGWPWHQIQQRRKYDYAVRERIGDVTEVYSTADLERALELLRRYEVEYVVVGQLERAYYPSQGLLKFDRMARDGMAELVYQNEGVKIYRGMWYN